MTAAGPGAPIALVGTTASGKSSLAMALARVRPRVELVSVDSMQVYRGMDIGTAKPSAKEQAEVVHYGLDLIDPWEEFTVAEFQTRINQVISEVESRGARALLVGGTGLYLRAIIDDLDVPGRYPDAVAELEAQADTLLLHQQLEALDPKAAARIEPNNRRRIVRALEVTVGSGRPFSSYGPGLDAYPESRFRLVGVRRPRSVIDERIEARYHAQLAAGFVDEVRRLRSSPQGVSRSAGQALGYKELAQYLEGESSLEEALDLAIRRTRKFARRQDRWFRRDPRIVWLDTGTESSSESPVASYETAGDEPLLSALLAIWDQT